MAKKKGEKGPGRPPLPTKYKDRGTRYTHTQNVVMTDDLRNLIYDESERRTRVGAGRVSMSQVICEILTAHYARRGAKK